MKLLFIALLGLHPGLCLASDQAGAASAAASSMARALFSERSGSGVPANPAELGMVKNASFMAGTQALLGGIFRHALGTRLKAGQLGSMALSFSSLEYGDFESFDEQGDSLGMAQARDISIQSAWGRSFGQNLSLGISGEAAYQNSAGDAFWSGSASLGTAYQAFKRLDLGLGATWKPDSESALIRAGVAWDAGALIPGLGMMSSMLADFSAGHEFQFALQQALGKTLQLRMGYGIDANGLRQDSGGLSLGGGVTLDDLTLDYAFVPKGPLGNTHALTATWAFKGQGASSAATGSAPAPLVVAATEPIEAPQALAAAPAETPQSLERRLRLLSSEHLKARQLENAGQHREALLAFLRCVTQEPKDLASWQALERLYLRFGRKEYAEACRQKIAHLEFATNQVNLAP